LATAGGQGLMPASAGAGAGGSAAADRGGALAQGRSGGQGAARDPASFSPVSATPEYVLGRALELAGAGAGDTVLDVGCNDGRMLVAAARLGCRAVGLELLPEACAKARARAEAAGPDVAARVEVVCGDALAQDFRIVGASVVFLYLLPKGLAAVGARLLRALPQGARVVSFLFKIPGEEWEALREETVGVTSGAPGKMDVSGVSKLHLYRVGRVGETSTAVDA